MKKLSELVYVTMCRNEGRLNCDEFLFVMKNAFSIKSRLAEVDDILVMSGDCPWIIVFVEQFVPEARGPSLPIVGLPRT